jgi:competence protein ComGC
MKGVRAAIVRRLAQDAGFTLVEVLVVAMTLSFVLIALLSLSDTTQKLAPKDQERAHVLRESQVGLHRMTRELRQAYDMTTWNDYVMDVNVKVNGADKRVVYKCNQAHPTDSGFYSCVRYEVFVNGSTTPQETVIDRVAKTTVFTYPTLKNGKPLYVTAKVEVPSKGDLKDGYKYRDVLDDGFFLRNRDLG